MDNENTYHRISIMGCGWLGLPLARRLINENHFVKGSTTTMDKIALLEPEGIEPYYLKLDPLISGDDVSMFFNADTVVLNIPPPRVEDRVTFMKQQAEELVSYINTSPVSRVVMVSSTSVYGANYQDADENDPHPPDTENGKGLLAMEQQLLHGLQASVAIIRMSGLIGPGRNPGRFLSERSGSSGSSREQKTRKRSISGDGNEPVNLIHLEDACGVIIHLIQQPKIAGIFNASAQEHPSRKEFYTVAAAKLGFEAPGFSDPVSRPWKRIISERIRQETGYQFVYNNPMDALDDM